MSATPKVSVLLSVFDRTRFLPESIRSALDQSYPHLELIVTDDSPDARSAPLCNAFASDPRLRYRRNPQTLGVALNFAAALQQASGEFVLLLNDDDLMEPTLLEQLLPPLLANPCCTLAFTDHWLINPDGELLFQASLDNSATWARNHLRPGLVPDPLALALRGGIPFVMGTLVRRSALRHDWFIPQIAGAYDFWLALQIARLDGDIAFVPGRHFRYRAHPQSESARLHPEKAACQVYILSELLKKPLARRHRAFAQRLLAHFLFVLGRDRLYFGHRAAARSAFAQSFRRRSALKTFAGLLATFLPRQNLRSLAHSWRQLRGIPTPLPATPEVKTQRLFPIENQVPSVKIREISG